MQQNAGPGTMFKTLPVLFDQMPGGIVFGPLFFLLLSIAALTSTISILEVPVAYAIDEKGWKRKRAAVIIGAVALLFGIPSALGQGAVPFFTKLPLFNVSFLDLWMQIWGVIALSVGAFFIALFVGWGWKTSNAPKEIKEGSGRFMASKAWIISIKYIAPIIILAILIINIL